MAMVSLIFYTGLYQSVSILTAAATFDLPVARIEGYSLGSRELLRALRTAQIVPEAREFNDKELLEKITTVYQEEYAIRALAKRHGINSAIHRASIIERTEEVARLRDMLSRALMESDASQGKELAMRIAYYTQEAPEDFDEIVDDEYELFGIAPVFRDALYTDEDLSLYGLTTVFQDVEAGQVKGPVASAQGYYFFKVLNVFTDPQYVVQVKELFIPSSYASDIIEDSIQNASIHFYVHWLV